MNGKYLLIQDADLEYDPLDYEKLFLPLKFNADVVFAQDFRVVAQNEFYILKIDLQILY